MSKAKTVILVLAAIVGTLFVVACVHNSNIGTIRMPFTQGNATKASWSKFCQWVGAQWRNRSTPAQT